ncbi:flagellar biosynthetic protein FliQ [Sphingobium subterraneum]|uniref:Flagellar biosynthetic protein FliQ n=1 Tax=Sphingobium subterraneum TaxID=627688 RepID=A0A841J061_9SPHN|nr:flagellar biosynthetic protein FliQ [Sphingobium subterraneum]MBB6124313.1 flagellar biosynthetic protein FliQ [Sphingobium subterraneum]
MNGGLEAADMLQLARSALVLMLVIAGPMLVASLVIGVVIGLIQALTQIQEMTLTFVPKLIGIGLVMLLCLPMIGEALSHFMAQMSAHIIGP